MGFYLLRRFNILDYVTWTEPKTTDHCGAGHSKEPSQSHSTKVSSLTDHPSPCHLVLSARLDGHRSESHTMGMGDSRGDCPVVWLFEWEAVITVSSQGVHSKVLPTTRPAEPDDKIDGNGEYPKQLYRVALRTQSLKYKCCDYIKIRYLNFELCCLCNKWVCFLGSHAPFIFSLYELHEILHVAKIWLFAN